MMYLRGRVLLYVSLSSLALSSPGNSQEDSRLRTKVIEGAQKAAEGITQGAFDVIDKTDLSISYDQGSSLLSTGQTIELSALVKSLDKSPQRLNVTVAAWADADYPSDRGGEISRGAEVLADQRANAVANYIAGLGSFSKVSKINMAKRSNMFERMFSSDETMVKEAVYGKATNRYWLNYEASTIKEKGGSGKVVVVIYDVNQRAPL